MTILARLVDAQARIPITAAPVGKLEAGGLGISPEVRARLSPLAFEHVNFHGFYSFHRPDLGGGLRDLSRPGAGGPEDE